MGAGRGPGAGLTAEDVAEKKAEQARKNAEEKARINKINQARTVWYKSMMGEGYVAGNWQRIDEDELSPEEKEAQGQGVMLNVDSSDGRPYPESGVYKDDASKYAFRFNADNGSISTLGRGTPASYSEAMDFLANEAGAHTIVIDFPSAKHIDEKLLGQLLKMAAEKNLNVEFGDNVMEYLTSDKAMQRRLDNIALLGPTVGASNEAHAAKSLSLYDYFNTLRKSGNRSARDFNSLYTADQDFKKFGEELDAVDEGEKLFAGDDAPDIAQAKSDYQDSFKESGQPLADEAMRTKFNAEMDKLEKRIERLENFESQKQSLGKKKEQLGKRLDALKKQRDSGLKEFPFYKRGKMGRALDREIARTERNLELVDKTLENISELEGKFAKERQEIAVRQGVLADIAGDPANADALRPPESVVEPAVPSEPSELADPIVKALLDPEKAEAVGQALGEDTLKDILLHLGENASELEGKSVSDLVEGIRNYGDDGVPDVSGFLVEQAATAEGVAKLESAYRAAQLGAATVPVDEAAVQRREGNEEALTRVLEGLMETSRENYGEDDDQTKVAEEAFGARNGPGRGPGSGPGDDKALLAALDKPEARELRAAIEGEPRSRAALDAAREREAKRLNSTPAGRVERLEQRCKAIDASREAFQAPDRSAAQTGPR